MVKELLHSAVWLLTYLRFRSVNPTLPLSGRLYGQTLWCQALTATSRVTERRVQTMSKAEAEYHAFTFRLSDMDSRSDLRSDVDPDLSA